jgi:DNA repair protein RecO (recombination protein O)
VKIATGSHLPVLTQAQLEDSFYPLREDIWRSAYAGYACELADRALPDGEPQDEVFELLLLTLRGLTQAPDGAALMHSFELRLLALLGYEPVLDRCVLCGQPVQDDARFLPAAGGLAHAAEAPAGSGSLPIDPATVRALRRLLRPEDYDLDLSQIRIPPAVLRPLREITKRFLVYHLESEPKALGFLEQLYAQDAE